MPCEACSEEETFVTAVTPHTTTAVIDVSSTTATVVTGVTTEDDTVVTGVTLTKTTQDIIIPIIMTPVNTSGVEQVLRRDYGLKHIAPDPDE